MAIVVPNLGTAPKHRSVTPRKRTSYPSSSRIVQNTSHALDPCALEFDTDVDTKEGVKEDAEASFEEDVKPARG